MDTKITLLLGAAGLVTAFIAVVLAFVAIIAVLIDLAVGGVVALVVGARGFGRLLEWWVRDSPVVGARTSDADAGWLGDWLLEATPRSPAHPRADGRRGRVLPEKDRRAAA